MTADPADQLEIVGEIADGLRDAGLRPVLVGGMALVVLGSRRVTRDFDFVVAAPGDNRRRVVNLFFDHGLELASRLNETGDVVATIRNRRVAEVRLRIDAPSAVFFYNPITRLRVDLLFDFPMAVSTLAERATRMTIRSHAFDVASAEDLLELKQIARGARSSPGDAEDIAFLESYLARRR